ncbi:GNAT family N-acetyltransferase [Yinghuangia seranimata]|uniref:GNAT family N-acetyltransferase n=1 Tax=Yinghuangia seranimata TaxID=408067 RepID=UPI00248C9E43|nr:GNAT family N-acetyltransferase [Yinghuangia seranimata]MDI2127634.1 GNAT family N-acetyltransferase [Yinghuangia seranimata]
MTTNTTPPGDLLERVEAYLDAVPRAARPPEDFGSLTLFLQEGDGWPYYARPTLGHAAQPTVGDVAAVRLRQRELGVPEAFEWVHESTPGLRDAAERAGLRVHSHPLMVLDVDAFHAAERPAPPDVTVRRVPHDALDLAIVQSVPAVAFSEPGTAVGLGGADLRDAAAPGQPLGLLRYVGERLRAERTVTYAAYGAKGPLAVGSHQPRGGASELVGIGTLPDARRQGLGAAVTWHLTADALDRGLGLVLLSAGDEDVARIYGRLGFRRVATSMIAEPSTDD